MKPLVFLQTAALLGIANTAHAEVTNSGVLDQALKQYRAAAQGWQNAAQGAATSLFWSLATISLVWTMGQLALRRAELGEFFGEFIRFLLFTGFWAWMLNNGAAHAELIMNSMVKLAGSAGGNVSGQQVMSPSGVVDVGFHVVDRALTQSTILSPLDSAIGILLSLVILVVLALVGVNMLVTLISCWIVAYGGLIVLGFGGSRWTSDMAVNYYRLVLALALQVLAMVLLVGIGESFLRGYYSALGKDVKLEEQAVLLVVSIVLLVTVNRVPALLGSLASGPGSHHAVGGAGAGAAFSTMSTAGALAANGAAPAVASAAWLTKAAAVGAAVGGRAGISSLVNAFRSSDDERSAGAGGGSVFPAPQGTDIQRATAAGVMPPQGDVAARSGAGGREPGLGLTWPLKRGERDGQTEDAEQGGRSEAAQQETSVATIGDTDAEPSAEQGAGESDSGGSTEAAGDTDHEGESARLPGVPDAVGIGPKPNMGREEPENDAASSPRAHTFKDSASSGEGSNHSAASSQSGPLVAQAAPTHAGGNGTVTSMTSGGAPAGTFTSPVPSGSRAQTSSDASNAPPTAGFASQRMTPAPAGALAGAAGRATVIVPNDPAFTNTASLDGGGPSKTPVAKLNEAAERADLPTAYKTQTAVDVEAEVAAFRDKE